MDRSRTLTLPCPDGSLAPDTHLVRAQPVDGKGRPLLRRDPQHMRGVAFDAALTPSDPQVVRYLVPAGTARLRISLNVNLDETTIARFVNVLAAQLTH